MATAKTIDKKNGRFIESHTSHFSYNKHKTTRGTQISRKCFQTFQEMSCKNIHSFLENYKKTKTRNILLMTNYAITLY